MEEQYLGDGVNIKKWALTRRQRVLLDISYGSSCHNIYSPHYSSRASSSLASNEENIREDLWEADVRSRGASSKEAEAFAEFISENSPKQIKGAISQSNFGNQVQAVVSGRETSSDLSVAEERDTISATAIAVTPNISRIMNICSISKIEQHSLLTIDSNKNTPHAEQSRSVLSQQKPKQKKSVFKMNAHQMPNNSAFRLNHLVKDRDSALEIIPSPDNKDKEQIEEFKFSAKDPAITIQEFTRNEGSKLSSFANHFKYQSASSAKQSLIQQVHKSSAKNGAKGTEKVFNFNKKDRKNYLAAGNNYTPQLLKPILNKHPPTQKNLNVNYNSSNQNLAKKYNSGWDPIGSSTTISYNKMSEPKSKINFDDQEGHKNLTKKPSSNNLLIADSSSLLNPYETMANSPQIKEINLGQGLKTSSINIPNAFPSIEGKEVGKKSPLKQSYSKNRHTLVKS